MFQASKSAMEGADSLLILGKVEQRLDEIIQEKAKHKASDSLRTVEKRVRTELQNKKQSLKAKEDEKAKSKKVIDKEERYKTAQERVLKGKERMQPTRPQKKQKETKKDNKIESDAFNDKYFDPFQ